MPLVDFAVVQTTHQFQLAGPLITARDGDGTVVVHVRRTALEDHLEVRSLSADDRNLLADRNLQVLAKIAAAKYDRGETSTFRHSSRDYPFVGIALADIKASGESLEASVLDVAKGSGWRSR